ncbi:MAG: bifunctional phosphopantothenoylcysteine decarboxylase/phosphopantothenate--cysteine ligase CoaBC [Desulfovibrionaceae bacterium]|nr:bifunctional phosphopantothenoylcysteine decarboxylase/phosphopantothenate--cysteine ligase CoaBC [Desulfovibrionaceae bacterium]
MDAHLDFTGYAGRRLHLGVCGSVAAYKALDLLRAWLAAGVSVSATLSDAAARFVAPLSFRALGADPVYGSMFPAAGAPGAGGPAAAGSLDDDDVFGHLAPGRAAHAFAVVPATADTLAKLAHGLADTMLACQALAFPGPLVIAPAMNPNLWNATATRENWAVLKGRGHVCIEPGCGLMACGDTGEGRLAEGREIFLRVLKALTPQDMAGLRVLVTMGPTREQWDAVRFWSNPSSGTMGAALAVAAWLRGAQVDAVRGPADVFLPADIALHPVTSAAQMFEACEALWGAADVGVFSAAVADFAPVPFGAEKFKKAAGELRVDFAPTRDILGTLGPAKRPGQRILGFAAETADLSANARKKLASKNADLVAANPVGTAGSGFRVPTNAVYVADRNGREEQWPQLAKTEVAWRLLDWLLQL